MELSEKFGHRQECPLFVVVLAAFPPLTAASHILRGAVNPLWTKRRHTIRTERKKEGRSEGKIEDGMIIQFR